MARLTACLLAFTLAMSQFGVDAAPLSSRNVIAPGNYLQCNIARIKTFIGLAATNSAVHKMSKVAGSDPVMTAAVASAQSGLKDAQTGINTISHALILRQQPPTAARHQVAKGLNAVLAALAGVKTSDQIFSAQVNNAMAKLKNTMAAGQQVVNICGTGAVQQPPQNGAARPSSQIPSIPNAVLLHTTSSTSRSMHHASPQTTSPSTVRVTGTASSQAAATTFRGMNQNLPSSASNSHGATTVSLHMASSTLRNMNHLPSSSARGTTTLSSNSATSTLRVVHTVTSSDVRAVLHIITSSARGTTTISSSSPGVTKVASMHVGSSSSRNTITASSTSRVNHPAPSVIRSTVTGATRTAATISTTARGNTHTGTAGAASTTLKVTRISSSTAASSTAHVTHKISSTSSKVIQTTLKATATTTLHALHPGLTTSKVTKTIARTTASTTSHATLIVSSTKGAVTTKVTKAASSSASRGNVITSTKNVAATATAKETKGGLAATSKATITRALTTAKATQTASAVKGLDTAETCPPPKSTTTLIVTVTVQPTATAAATTGKETKGQPTAAAEGAATKPKIEEGAKAKVKADVPPKKRSIYVPKRQVRGIREE